MDVVGIAVLAGLALLAVLAYLYMPSLKGLVGGVGNVGKQIVGGVVGGVVDTVGGAISPVTDAIGGALSPVAGAIGGLVPSAARGWLPTSARDVASLPGRALADPLGAAKAAVVLHPAVLPVSVAARVLSPVLPPGLRFNPAKPWEVVDVAGNLIGVKNASGSIVAGGKKIFDVAGGKFILNNVGLSSIVKLPGGRWASKIFPPLPGPAGDAARAALGAVSKVTDVVGGVASKVGGVASSVVNVFGGLF